MVESATAGVSVELMNKPGIRDVIEGWPRKEETLLADKGVMLPNWGIGLPVSASLCLGVPSGTRGGRDEVASDLACASRFSCSIFCFTNSVGAFDLLRIAECVEAAPSGWLTGGVIEVEGAPATSVVFAGVVVGAGDMYSARVVDDWATGEGEGRPAFAARSWAILSFRSRL